jgi:hypothetical protein
MRTLVLIALLLPNGSALVPLIDGGKQMPALYNGWMNEQIAKQAATGVANAIAAGYDKIEVQLPPVPNLDEVGNLHHSFLGFSTVTGLNLTFDFLPILLFCRSNSVHL